MNYKIGQLSEITGLSVHTLRYYEKEGILTGIQRGKNGQRFYTQRDVDTLETVECMKKAGMNLESIRENIRYFDHRPENAEKRIEIFQKQRDELLKRIQELQDDLEIAEFKIWYYQNIEVLDSESEPGHTRRMKEYYREVTGKTLPVAQ